SETEQHTISLEIPQHVLKTGEYGIDLPFNNLDGFVTIKGEVSDSGVFSFIDMIPQQKITFNQNNDNSVQFFVSEDENPLRFIIEDIDTNGTLSIELIAQDSMSYIRKVRLTDEQPIYATHNNIDPQDASPDEELAKWNVKIEKDSLDKENPKDLIFNITFLKSSPYSDIIFFPFSQLYMDWKAVRGAVIGMKIIPELTFIYGEYYVWNYDYFLKDSTIGPSFDIRFHINDKGNRLYDTLLWTKPAVKDQKVFPLRMLHLLPPSYGVLYEYDNNRTKIPGEKDSLSDNVFFKSISFLDQLNLNSSTGDTIRLYKYPGSQEFYFRKCLIFENGIRFLTMTVEETGESYTIKDSKFTVYQYFLNGNKKDRRFIEFAETYENYYGFDFQINSSDSLTIIPSDAAFMAKLNFWATNSYQTAEPWRNVDTIPPTIVSTEPKDNSKDVSINTDIKIKFNEELIQGLINKNNFTISWEGNQDSIYYVNGSYIYKDSTAIFEPSEPLLYETEYGVSVLNLPDLAGNKIENYNFTFTTEPDTTISVNESNVNGGLLKIIPNPAEDNILLSITIGKNHDIIIRLYDLFGKSRILYEGHNMSTGEYQVQVNLEELPSGFYFIREERSGITHKFIKR
ncbi:Ig-like domain-containing protein, partial [Bacteroidota bacterium]